MLAHRIEEFGGPEVLGLVDVDEPACGPDEVVVQHLHVGVNFVDTQHRRGAPYPVELPLIPGIEAAGRVIAVGDRVRDVAAGDRVAYGGVMAGVYAERAAVAADQLIALPDDVPTEIAAAVLLQGWTAHMLACDVAPGEGDTVVVYAAAGGTGALVVQLAVGQGRRVIGVASGSERCTYVESLGADVVVDRRAGGVLDAVLAASPGGVDVVFDGVGGPVFDEARRMLRPRGHLVAFGQSAGPVPPIDPAVLSGISPVGGPGSLSLTWPTLNDHNATAAARRARADAVFSMVRAGTLTPRVDEVVDLADAARAHRLVEAGAVTGKLVLSVSG